MATHTKSCLDFEALLAAVLVVITLLGSASCASKAPARRFEQAPPPGWYEQRHKDAMRDFYGYHARIRQYRLELALQREFLKDEWWDGQVLRRRARERRFVRDAAIERDFFRMQKRQELARGQRGKVDTEAQEKFLAALVRTQKHLQRREEKNEEARREVLRSEAARRQRQVHQLTQARRAERRLANRPLAPVRGGPPQSRFRRQLGQFAGGSQQVGVGAPPAGASLGGGIQGGGLQAGATIPAAGGGAAPQ